MMSVAKQRCTSAAEASGSALGMQKRPRSAGLNTSEARESAVRRDTKWSKSGVTTI